jgi:hypothetical protein
MAATRMSQREDSQNLGAIEGGMLEARLRLLDWPVFQTRDSLEQMLWNTDIGADTPCSFFRLPYKRVFIECGQTRQSPYRIHNAVSGAHVFEGAYLEEFMRQDDHGREIRSIYMQIIGSPVGKQNFLDDCFYTIGIPLTDENESLETMLTRVFGMAEETVEEMADALPAGTFRSFDDQERATARDCIFHIAKVLLYLNTQDARTERNAEKSDLAKRLAGLKGGGKKSKVERKMAKAYDRVIVGAAKPVQPDVSAAPGEPGRKMGTHWRRGHFRQQPHGEGRALRKLVLIEAVLVRGDLMGVDVKSKGYDVGSRIPSPAPLVRAASNLQTGVSA